MLKKITHRKQVIPQPRLLSHFKRFTNKGAEQGTSHKKCFMIPPKDEYVFFGYNTRSEYDKK